MVFLVSLFKTICSLSFYATFIIVVVIVIRTVFKKAPRNFSYALWVFVLLRLIVPINFESKISVLNVPTVALGIHEFKDGMTIFENAQQTYIVDKGAGGIALSEILACIWFIGILCLMMFLVLDYLRLKKKVRYAFLIMDYVYELETISVPFVFGIVKPKIYMPTGIEEEKKRIILAHEIVHVERKDYLVKIIALFVLAVYWFNPFVWISYLLMCKDMEFSCDEKVIERLGLGCKREFGNALLDYALRPYTLIVTFSETNTKARIKNIMNYKKPKFWIVTLCIVVGCVLFVPLLSNPISNLNTDKIDGKETDESGSQNSSTYQTPSPETIMEDTQFTSPLASYEVTCNWGCYEGHDAIDMNDPNNDSVSILAVQDGKVSEIGFEKVLGNYIVIEHDGGYTSLYGQIKDNSIVVNKNDTVKQGDSIATVGMSGQASGVHVHFQLKKDNQSLENTLDLIS